jgi:hypothetical protein
MMHVLWGILMVAAGLFMLVCGTLKSEFIIYRLMVARSRILWGQGDAVHRFYQVSGLTIVIWEPLWALGVIWQELISRGDRSACHRHAFYVFPEEGTLGESRPGCLLYVAAR